MGTLTAILGTLKAFFGFGQAVAVDVGNAAQQKAGMAEQKATDQAPVIVAQDAMAKAGAEPAGRDATGKRLGDGSF